MTLYLPRRANCARCNAFSPWNMDGNGHCQSCRAQLANEAQAAGAIARAWVGLTTEQAADVIEDIGGDELREELLRRWRGRPSATPHGTMPQQEKTR